MLMNNCFLRKIEITEQCNQIISKLTANKNFVGLANRCQVLLMRMEPLAISSYVSKTDYAIFKKSIKQCLTDIKKFSKTASLFSLKNDVENLNGLVKEFLALTDLEFDSSKSHSI